MRSLRKKGERGHRGARVCFAMREGYLPGMQMIQKRTGQQRPRFLVWLSIGFYWLIKLEWLAVAVAAPLLLFPTVRPLWTAMTLIVLTMLWFLRWLVRREPWSVTPFNGALLLFALMIPVAIWASALPELTLPKAAGLVLGLAVFRATTLAVRNRRALSLALVAFCLLGLAILAVGVLGAKWPAKVDLLDSLARTFPRLVSSLPGMPDTGISTNQLAGTLILYLPLLAILAGSRIHLGSTFRRWLVSTGTVGFLLLTAAVLLLTQSRGGWVGGMVSLLTLLALWGLSSSDGRMRIVGAALPLLALLAITAFLLYLGPYQVGEILYEANSGATVEQVVGEMSVAGRIEIWNRALYAVQDFPFTGCGLGTFRRVVHILYPLFLIPPDTDIAHAHNIFLQTALDLGLPGLIAYLALLGIALATCWRCARRGGPLVRATALGLAAGLVGLHVYGLADAVALGSKPGVAFWFALGLIAALPNVARQEAREGAPKPCLTHHGSRITHYALRPRSPLARRRCDTPLARASRRQRLPGPGRASRSSIRSFWRPPAPLPCRPGCGGTHRGSSRRRRLGRRAGDCHVHHHATPSPMWRVSTRTPWLRPDGRPRSRPATRPVGAASTRGRVASPCAC